MQIKIITLPIYSSERSEDELNKFLRSHRILQTERHFCPDNGGYWTILVEYLDNDSVANVLPASRKDHKDYAKELKEEELSRYDNFKKIRRKLGRSGGQVHDRSCRANHATCPPDRWAFR